MYQSRRYIFDVIYCPAIDHFRFKHRLILGTEAGWRTEAITLTIPPTCVKLTNHLADSNFVVVFGSRRKNWRGLIWCFGRKEDILSEIHSNTLNQAGCESIGMSSFTEHAYVPSCTRFKFLQQKSQNAAL
jgi:hypothetical protein